MIVIVPLHTSTSIRVTRVTRPQSKHDSHSIPSLQNVHAIQVQHLPYVYTAPVAQTLTNQNREKHLVGLRKPYPLRHGPGA